MSQNERIQQLLENNIDKCLTKNYCTLCRACTECSEVVGTAHQKSDTKAVPTLQKLMFRYLKP